MNQSRHALDCQGEELVVEEESNHEPSWLTSWFASSLNKFKAILSSHSQSVQSLVDVDIFSYANPTGNTKIIGVSWGDLHDADRRIECFMKCLSVRWKNEK